MIHETRIDLLFTSCDSVYKQVCTKEREKLPSLIYKKNLEHPQLSRNSHLIEFCFPFIIRNVYLFIFLLHFTAAIDFSLYVNPSLLLRFLSFSLTIFLQLFSTFSSLTVPQSSLVLSRLFLFIQFSFIHTNPVFYLSAPFRLLFS